MPINDDTHPTGENARVLDGIRSLHERMDALERVVARRVETEETHATSLLHARAGTTPALPPAWRRRTEGEARWQAALCTAAAIALQVAVPDRLVLLSPAWALPALEAVMLAALVAANPYRINRESRALRLFSLTLAGLLTFANAWTVERLAVGLVNGHHHWNAGELLSTGAAVWLTNVIIFAMWYWEFDRGGPVARALATKQYPDFMFPQMSSPDLAPQHWEPAFADYLYLAFTNAAAFSPTDVMPMSRWAKMAMTVQAGISVVTVVLVVARAVNILGS